MGLIENGGTGFSIPRLANHVLVANGTGYVLTCPLPVAAGGTGINAIPGTNQILLGNGIGYSSASTLPMAAVPVIPIEKAEPDSSPSRLQILC